jgi:oleate hydratase
MFLQDKFLVDVVHDICVPALAMVRPAAWSPERGVTFALNTRVTDLGLTERGGQTTVIHIEYVRDGQAGKIVVDTADYVHVTLGSMTEASSLDSMDVSPVLNGKANGGAWTLWETIAKDRPAFGHPSVFARHIDESMWVSFTTALHDPSFPRLVCDMTGNVPGEDGLMIFPDSNWLASIVIPFQPHFIGLPDDVTVLWGYGLAVDNPGNFVKKQCRRVRGVRS